MKLANVDGRAAVVVAEDLGSGAIDVERASSGRYGPDVQPLYDDWSAFRTFAADLDPYAATSFDEGSLRSPVPAPRQVFAIGLNYRSHAEESGMAVPDVP